MKEKKLLDLMEQGIIIPPYLLKYKEELNIDYEELIFISLLLSYDKNIAFDVNKFKNKLYIKDLEVMKIISSLIEKKLLTMNVIKSDGKMKEYIDISIIKNKIISQVKDQINNEQKVNTDSIYTTIEKEFGRTLSPIECETIKNWLDNKIEPDLIKDALKEAVLNGVNNLKYIDKILYEWKRNGKKKKETKEEKKVEIPEYNWWDVDE